MTIEVTDDSGSPRDTALVTIEIKDLMEDDETKTLEIPEPWHHHLDQNSRDPVPHGPGPRPTPGGRNYELNAQLDPCFKEGQPGLSRLHDRTPDWKIYDQYQLDMWWDSNTLKYRDPRRSQEWTGYSITQPDDTYYARGTNESCPTVYLDLWNDPDTLYALDTSHRLIKAYSLTAAGTQYEREHARDIPLSQDHYRGHQEIQGIWGNENHIWVNRAEQMTNADIHLAPTAAAHSSVIPPPTSTSRGYPATPGTSSTLTSWKTSSGPSTSATGDPYTVGKRMP